MEKPTKKTHVLIIFAIFCLSLLLLSRTVNGDGGVFDYNSCSEKGPKFWGGKCKNGKYQSPIALSKWTANFNRGLGDLRRYHRPTSAILKNDGHELIVDWIGNAGSIRINNIDYRLENYHWHHPSEHTQDGKTFPLELHMVHINNNANGTKDIVVVAVLFEHGPRDLFISQIERDIKRLNIEGGAKFLGSVDPRVVRLDGRKYFGYIGSLTTPPCTEGVIWNVMEQVQTVSPYQVELLKQAVVEENNARPLQNINDRDVFYFNLFSSGSAAE